jgi:hypothetical protein
MVSPTGTVRIDCSALWNLDQGSPTGFEVVGSGTDGGSAPSPPRVVPPSPKEILCKPLLAHVHRTSPCVSGTCGHRACSGPVAPEEGGAPSPPFLSPLPTLTASITRILLTFEGMGRLDRLNGWGAPIRSSCPHFPSNPSSARSPKEASPEERRLIQQSYKKSRDEANRNVSYSSRRAFVRRHLSSNTRPPCSTCSIRYRCYNDQPQWSTADRWGAGMAGRAAWGRAGEVRRCRVAVPRVAKDERNHRRRVREVVP